MSWSLQVMNGFETVFRTYDFGKYVQDALAHAVDARRLRHFEFSTTYRGEVAPLPRWWLRGFIPESETLIEDGR